MKKYLFLIISAILLITCSNTEVSEFKTISAKQTNSLIDSTGKTLFTRIAVPDSFERVKADTNSFGFYLRNFALKSFNSKVYYFNGEEKHNQNVVAAVLDIDVGKKDLQQCADAVMRLRAEYLFSKGKYDEIHFNFTNGFRADYKKWAEGGRIKIEGNNTSWYAGAEKSYSRETFKKYLEIVFSYAGTLSLSKELQSISSENIEPGDVFIYGGSPGHAVIVMDVAQHVRTKEKIFMIAQSYMPAQNIHLLKNMRDSISPWYNLQNSDKLYSPEWTFEKNSLKRFK